MAAFRLFLILSFLTFPLIIFSQKPPKYGKLTKEEKSIQSSTLDPEANAIILSDYGEIQFQGNAVTVIQHRRIKILNQKGVEEANITLPYYAKDGIEKIYKVKAQIFNKEENGKWEKTKLKKKEVYTVDVTENVKEKRFTFPNVQPGSIIEYEYIKTSENVVSLEEWNFQNVLPTIRSQLKVLISQGLDYKIVYSGSRLIQKYRNAGSKNNWLLENIPPLKDEDYCPNPQDYVETIRFQLAGYNSSGGSIGGRDYVNLMSTWEKLARDILEHKDYRGILKAHKSANKFVKQIISENDTDEEKVKKIYTFIQENIQWNGKYRMFPDIKFSKIMETKIGNSSEINLCLVRLLQSADLEASPLIISTKGHGKVTKVYPLYNQFNHVLAQVKIDGKDILMDAISPFRPISLLAKNDLNPEGFLLHRKDSRWIDIPQPKKTRTVIVTDLSFTEERMNLKMLFSFFGHEAAAYRSAFSRSTNEEDFIKKHLLPSMETDDLELDSLIFENEEDLEKPFAVTCYLSKELEEGLDASYLYIDPLMKKHYEKNPFINPNRYLPVDFILPHSERFILNLEIPKGYELAEKPQSIQLSTSNKKSIYFYIFNQPLPSKVQLSSQFVIKNPLFLPAEYSELREMFNQLMGLQAKQIVLKKI